MRRRKFLTSTLSAVTILAGCSADGDSSDDPNQDPTDTETATDTSASNPSETATLTHSPTPTATPTPTPNPHDTVIDFSVDVQDSADGEYDLPDPPNKGWSWIVVDFEVIRGRLDMGDVWFNGLFETGERYWTVSKHTDEPERGIDSRGKVREGSSGLILHEYPPTPASDLQGPMYSATETSIGGDGVKSDGPEELYPPVTVEYSVETGKSLDVLPNDTTPADGNTWAVVTLEVVDGVLNMEDVWFRSQLLTQSRIYDLSFTSAEVDYGVQARGMVKQGSHANAIYEITEGETIESWGYEDENRQNVTIQSG